MSDLLKQAIADAKAVRATALSNAKAALEEHFAPKLQSMLSEKLRAEVQGAETEEAPLPVDAGMEAGAGEEVHADAAQDAAMMAPAPDANVPVSEPAMAEEPVMEEEMDEEIEEEMDEVRGTINVTSAPDGAVNSEIHADTFVNEMEKASSDYKKTTSGHKTEDPGKKMVVDATKLSTKGSLSAGKKDAKASSDYTKTTAGHHTEDPQGASNEFSHGQKKTGAGTAALKEDDNQEVDESSLDEILKELEDGLNEVGMEEMAAPQEEAAHADEELNLDELLSETDDQDSDEEEIEEGKLPPGLAAYQAKKAGKSEKSEDEDEEKEEKEAVKENISLKKELSEYRSAVVYLRDRINEVNLLNAKLLYTNKLFKQASLNNEQKLKVIESFDLTKSVREAKLVYATLAESFNFGGKKTVEAAPKKVVSQTVKTITEGLASKTVASTKPTKAAVLTEGAIMANRFQKLAGIRK